MGTDIFLENYWNYSRDFPLYEPGILMKCGKKFIANCRRSPIVFPCTSIMIIKTDGACSMPWVTSLFKRAFKAKKAWIFLCRKL